MRILLDTHVFLWWSTAPEYLPAAIVALLQGGEQTLLLSIASIWEMQIKVSLGKLDLAVPLSRLIDDEVSTNGIILLPVHVSHIYALQELPHFHKVPFDRLLVAQALIEDLLIATVDRSLRPYPARFAI